MKKKMKEEDGEGGSRGDRGGRDKGEGGGRGGGLRAGGDRGGGNEWKEEAEETDDCERAKQFVWKFNKISQLHSTKVQCRVYETDHFLGLNR